ncbi:MAG: amino acid permease [Gemmataceae bacterium]|nr:amino acid permease [Gemmataceae bacterium]
MQPPPDSKPGLERVLGPVTATAIVVGTVIGSGIFKKPAAVAADVPFFGVAISAWILMAGLVMCGGLALAEVTALFPRAGGNYVFLREGFGRAFGFMWGWIDFTVIRTASIAALAVIFAESLHDLVRQLRRSPDEVFSFWQVYGLALGTILLLGLVNVCGVKWGGGLQTLLTFIKLGGMLAIALLPFGIIRFVEGAPTPSTANYEPLWPTADQPFNIAKFGSILIAILWPYHGWQNLGPVAGEVKNPQRNLPLALLLGIAIVAVMYLSLNFAYASVIPAAEMAKLKGQSVAAVFCNKLLGPVGGALAAGVVMCSVFGSLNGNILVGPRQLFAMGEDGLAPKGLSAIHPTFRTPARAIMVYTVWSMILLFGGALAVYISRQQGKKIPDPFDLLTDFAMFGAVVFETLVVASIYVFRRKYPAAPRVYKCPGYPVVPAIFVLAFLGVLASYFVNEEKAIQATSGVAFTLAGAAVYYLFLRQPDNA